MHNIEPVTKEQAANEILAREFTDRYLQRSGLSGIAYSAAYNPDDPLCDYEKTWWKANGQSHDNVHDEPRGPLRDLELERRLISTTTAGPGP